MSLQLDTMQYDAIKRNSVQYNEKQCYAMSMQCNKKQYNAMQCNTMQYNAIQCNTMQYNAIKCQTYPQLNLRGYYIL